MIFQTKSSAVSEGNGPVRKKLKSSSSTATDTTDPIVKSSGPSVKSSAVSEGSAPVKKKIQSSSSTDSIPGTHFKSYWLKVYHHLAVEEVEVNGTKVKRLYCKPCRAAPSRVSGSPDFANGYVNTCKKDTVDKHMSSAKHHRSVEHEINKLKNPIACGVQRVIKNIDSKTRNDLSVKFNTAYMVAKKELSFTLFHDLLMLQRINGIPVGTTYLSDVMCAKLIATVAEVLRDKLRDKLEACHYISCISDAGTDHGVAENEAVCVRYVCKGVPVVDYVGVVELQHAHAEGNLHNIPIVYFFIW
jgi:hypothetical protein